MRRRSRHLSTTFKLNLIPMLDMFTFVLIFLIVSYAPREAKFRTHASVKLPVATSKIQKASRLHLQVVGDELILNGKAISDFALTSATPESWLRVRDALKRESAEAQPVVLSADRDTEFGRLDTLVSKLSVLGYSQVYFLGLQKKEEK